MYRREGVIHVTRSAFFWCGCMYMLLAHLCTHLQGHCHSCTWDTAIHAYMHIYFNIKTCKVRFAPWLTLFRSHIHEHRHTHIHTCLHPHTHVRQHGGAILQSNLHTHPGVHILTCIHIREYTHRGIRELFGLRNSTHLHTA
jgi:hypothetical protein